MSDDAIFAPLAQLWESQEVAEAAENRIQREFINADGSYFWGARITKWDDLLDASLERMNANLCAMHMFDSPARDLLDMPSDGILALIDLIPELRAAVELCADEIIAEQTNAEVARALVC